MVISVINHTSGLVGDEELQTVVRAINHQLSADFAPYWGVSASLRLEGHPEREQWLDVRGDAVIYVRAEIDAPGALGYHERHHRGIPYGVVFTRLSQALKESWTVTLSHEALEMVGDPRVRHLVAGPSPADAGRDVFYWYELADAVQYETYLVEGVEVSNFVLPAYFAPDVPASARTDFLGTLHDGRPLPAFGVNPGGYVGFFDPGTSTNVVYCRPGDAVAAERLRLRWSAGAASRAMRYARVGQEVRDGAAAGDHRELAALVLER